MFAYFNQKKKKGNVGLAHCKGISHLSRRLKVKCSLDWLFFHCRVVCRPTTFKNCVLCPCIRMAGLNFSSYFV